MAIITTILAIKKLVLKSLLSHYKTQKEVNEIDKENFLSPFKINGNEHKIDIRSKEIQNSIEELFGSIDKFKEFASECFVDAEEIKRW